MLLMQILDVNWPVGFMCDQKEQERVPRQEEEVETRMSWSPRDWTSGWARSSVWRRWDVAIVLGSSSVS